jgi:hypothetical protein
MIWFDCDHSLSICLVLRNYDKIDFNRIDFDKSEFDIINLYLDTLILKWSLLETLETKY